MCYSPWSGRGSCLCRKSGLSRLASSLCPEWAWRTRHKRRSDSWWAAQGMILMLEADLHICASFTWSFDTSWFWDSYRTCTLYTVGYTRVWLCPLKQKTACYVWDFKWHAAIFNEERRREGEPGWNLVTPSPTLSTMPAPSWPSTTGKTPSGSEPLSV